MEEKKTKFIAWVKEHRKELLLAGISITAVMGVIIGIKNKDTIMNMWNTLENRIIKIPAKLPESMNVTHVSNPALEEVKPTRPYTSPREAFDVRQHIRNLANGLRHSAEKAAEAAAMGISLQPNQTLVDGYTKCVF